jgi:hypothetical protein
MSTSQYRNVSSAAIPNLLENYVMCGRQAAARTAVAAAGLFLLYVGLQLGRNWLNRHSTPFLLHSTQ